MNAWVQTVDSIVQATGPGWKGQGVLVAWSGFTHRAHQRALRTGTWLIDMEEMCRDLKTWLTEKSRPAAPDSHSIRI